MKIVIIGLTITSSWGNGHATTYRGLVKNLNKRGHDILFLEKDVEWYSSNRDLSDPDYCTVRLYNSFEELKDTYRSSVEDADLVIVGSYVNEGVKTGKWVQETAKGITAFYDIDTPVTLAKLKEGDYEYLTPDLIPGYNMYLSFTGGPTLELLEKEYGSPKARPLYCSVDPDLYYPEDAEKKWDLGYLGTYSADRQPPLRELMLDAARELKDKKFIVAGPKFPKTEEWPDNVERVMHLAPKKHRLFYNEQRFTMNITRANMVKAGYAPSVRLFEAAACGTPIITDYWDGLETFFRNGKNILFSFNTQDTVNHLTKVSDDVRRKIGENARQVILEGHTAYHRAMELEEYMKEFIKTAV